MIHVVGARAEGHLKAFDERGKLVFGPINAGWDTWGSVTNPGGGPYGHDWPAPPGHYLIGAPWTFSEPDDAEGFGQIPVIDIDGEHVAMLVAARKAGWTPSHEVTIGGITLPIGQQAKFGRDGMEIHGGGSNLGSPACYADYQRLLKTFECTRVFNADWKRLAAYITAARATNTVIYSIVGDALALPGS